MDGQILAHELKVCTKCKSEKSTFDFHKHKGRKDGLSNWCKVCAICNVKKWSSENEDRRDSYIKMWRINNPKYNADYYERTKDLSKARFKKWTDQNPEKNKNRIAKWSLVNKAKMNEKCMRRVATKKQATPKWADLKEIELFYQASLAFKLYTGQEYNVDHIVPLKSEFVCGLHVPANLQVLTKTENVSKKNYWWPDMWT